MTTYVFRDGKWVDKAEATPLHYSDDAPHYISDHMDPLVHHAAMRIIDSKSEFRRETKAHGCIEVGSQKDYGLNRAPQPKLSNQERKQDIQKAIYQLRNGRG